MSTTYSANITVPLDEMPQELQDAVVAADAVRRLLPATSPVPEMVG